MDSFPQLNLPPCELKMRPDADSRRGGAEVYDVSRRRWVALTPEEWVRQNFVAFLTACKGYPQALTANEVPLRLNGLSRRCDTVVYDRSLHPLVLVEYKAPSIEITQKVFDQIARYNIVLGAPFLIVSNGLSHYCCRFSGDSYTFLRDIPLWQDIAQ